jgi:hypothetical protein
MSSSTLKFSELVPAERDFFELDEGEKIPFRTQQDFDAVDVANFRRLQSEFTNVMKGMGKDEGPESESVEAGKKLDGLADELIRAILPDIPQPALDTLGLMSKEQIMVWWTDRNGGAPGSDSEADADSGNSKKPATTKETKRGRRRSQSEPST